MSSRARAVRHWLSDRISLASERGSLLIEVMVGAIVLSIATFAVFDALEGAQATGLTNKQRSTSAALAQQDIERLRAYPITALSNFSQTRAVDVAGVDYSVKSETEWIRDSSGVVNCTDDSGQADYLKISSTVNSVPQTNPVKEVSLLTPAAGSLSDTHGTLNVRITDRNGQPRANTTVTLTGASSFSKTTNELGCAIFDYIPVATYTVNVPGLVTWGGEGASSSAATVVAGKTSLKSIEMESPASIRAHLRRPDGTAASWTSIQVANAKLPGGVKNYTSATPVTAIDTDGLFPFLDGYGVYAGTCARNNPAVWQSNYYSTSGFGFALLTPGEFLRDVNVQMGVLNVNVRNSAGTNLAGALVAVRQRDTGSGCNQDLLMATSTTDAAGNASYVLPFGTYRVCVSGRASVSSTTIRFRQTSGTSGSTQDPRLRPPTSSMTFASNLQLPSSGSTGACSTAADLTP